MEFNKTDLSNDFGVRIKNLRESRGILLVELSSGTGISCSYLNRLESGKRTSPSVRIILALSQFFKISVDELLFGTNTLANIYGTNIKIIEELNEYQKLLLSQIIQFIVNIDWTKQEERWDKMIDLSLIIDQFKRIKE